MKVLINPKIQINVPKKKNSYVYTVTLDEKNLNQLTIKRQTKEGKDKRTIGCIERSGQINIKPHYVLGFTNASKVSKFSQIEMTLDLVFGPKRDRVPTINKQGNVEFKK